MSEFEELKRRVDYAEERLRAIEKQLGTLDQGGGYKRFSGLNFLGQNTQVQGAITMTLPGGLYASTTSITVVGDWSARLKVGSPLHLLQPATGAKYFYVTALSYSAVTGLTTLTVTGGADYLVANEPILDCQAGVGRLPGHPEWFSFVSAWSSSGNPQPSLGNGTLNARFRMEGDDLTLLLRLVIGTTTTLGTNNWSFTLPVAARTDNSLPYLGQAITRRPGVQNFPSFVKVPSGATTLTFFIPTHQIVADIDNLTPAYPIAWAANDYLEVHVRYRTA